MKTFLLLLFLPLWTLAQPPAPVSSIETQPLGNVYLDSEYLLHQLDQENIGEIVRIINVYSHVPSNNVDTTVIAKTIRTNRHLRELLEQKLPDINKYLANSADKFRAQAILADGKGTSATGVSALTLFPARKIADGLGTFIAERFKEELTQRYLQAFRDTIILNDSKYKFSVLMPRTFIALVQYENVFDYRAFMTTLKEAFKDDLDNLAPNAITFTEALKAAGRIHVRDDHFYLMHYLADFIINKIPEGKPLTTLLTSLSGYPHKDKLDPKVFGYVNVAGIVSANLANNIGEIDAMSINRLLFNRRRLTAFSGLLIEKEKDQLQQLNMGEQHAYDFLNTSIDGIEKLAMTARDLRVAFSLFSESDKTAGDVARLSLKAMPAIQNLLTQFDVMTPSELSKVMLSVSHAVNIYDLSAEQKYGLIITEALSMFADLGLSHTPFMMTFKKYGLFISNVAQAETAQEVKEALDIAALPVGSYKIKRNSFFDISFNAYPGLASGAEFRSGIPSGADVASVNPTIAFTAPVGLGFSWGQVKVRALENHDSTINRHEIREIRDGKWFARYTTGRSHTLFFSVLDIGAITSFRLIDDDTETLPEFNWNNILAPGLYYLNGWKNSPISLGLGVQYGPQLRRIEAGGTVAELDKSLFSVRALLVVDVPIFSFYTRTGLRNKRQ